MVKKIVWLNWLLFTAFGFSTALAIFFIFNNESPSYAEEFIYGYICFVFLYVLYLGITALKYWKNTNQTEIKIRMIRFIGWFVVLSIISFILNIFKQDSNGSFAFLFIPLGFSFGIAFLDVLFMKEK